jgi:hypothetical protein
MEMAISPDFKKFLETNIENLNPEFVYHYTDIDVLLSILEKGELWLTDRNYMNDVYDESYIKDIINKYTHSINSNILTDGATFDDRGYQNKKDSYMFSTSIKRDVVNQWLCYGNGSVCIEFKRNELDEYINEFATERQGNKLGFAYRDDFLSYPISYDEEIVEKFKLFLKEKYGNDSSKSGDKNIDTLQETIYAHYDLRAICGFIKQKEFAAEEEYRFLLLSNQKPCFRTRNGRLIPFIKVRGKDSRLPIKSIIIGPKGHNEYTQNAVRRLLIKHCYSEVGIEQTRISLR